MGEHYRETFREHMLDQSDRKHRVRLVTIQRVTKEGATMQGVDANAPSQGFELLDKKTRRCVASMKTQILPGCCGAIVFYWFTGSKEHVNKLVMFGLRGASEARFGVVLATTRDSANFEPGTYANSFINGKTGHTLKLFVTYLGQAAPAPPEYDAANDNEE